jgi:hypothetical protein
VRLTFAAVADIALTVDGVARSRARRARNMFHIPAVSWGQASAAQRDRFLNALDGCDTAAISASAQELHGCRFSLPGETCILLGLAPGSTYGDAAAVIAASATCAIPRPAPAGAGQT